LPDLIRQSSFVYDKSAFELDHRVKPGDDVRGVEAHRAQLCHSDCAPAAGFDKMPPVMQGGRRRLSGDRAFARPLSGLCP
jgi:hypothetical protein